MVWVTTVIVFIEQQLPTSGLERKLVLVFIPNRTFLVRFGGISSEFGPVRVRILVRRSQAKIPMARPNEPAMTPGFAEMEHPALKRPIKNPQRHLTIATGNQMR